MFSFISRLFSWPSAAKDAAAIAAAKHHAEADEAQWEERLDRLEEAIAVQKQQRQANPLIDHGYDAAIDDLEADLTMCLRDSRDSREINEHHIELLAARQAANADKRVRAVWAWIFLCSLIMLPCVGVPATAVAAAGLVLGGLAAAEAARIDFPAVILPVLSLSLIASWAIAACLVLML